MVAEVVGEDVLRVAMGARDGAALVTERERLMAEYEKIVGQGPAAGSGTGEAVAPGTLAGSRAGG